MSIIRVALVQARPQVLDLQRSLEKAVSLIEEAADQGAEWVAFAEVRKKAFGEIYFLGSISLARVKRELASFSPMARSTLSPTE
jgi:predicted amidohydrolase